MPTAQCNHCSKPATTMFDGLPMCDACYGQLRPMPVPAPQPELPPTDRDKLELAHRLGMTRMQLPVPSVAALLAAAEPLPGDIRLILDNSGRMGFYQDNRWTLFQVIAAPATGIESGLPYYEKHTTGKPTPAPNHPIAQIDSKLPLPINITNTERRHLAVGSYVDDTVMFEALDKTRPAMFRLVLKHEELPNTIAALQLLWQEREMARMRMVEHERDEQVRREIERMMEPSPGIKDGDD